MPRKPETPGAGCLRKSPSEEAVHMWLDAVRVFPGADHEVAVVPPTAKALVGRLDAGSAHSSVRDRRPEEPAWPE